MTNALIFAGGSGKRMNSRSRPKQFLRFYDKELIVHTLENFQNHPEVDGIAVVCIEGWISYMERLVEHYALSKVRAVVPGGMTGQESIFKGLLVLKDFAPDDSIVLVHDGVRPFVPEILISNCIECVQKHGSAITVTPAIETIVTQKSGKITAIIDRSECFHAKAPQCFFLGDLLAAHKKARADGKLNMIDSASLMQFYGHELFTVEGGFDNIKITTPADFYMFKALYEVHEQQQIFGL
ncbi:MAG: 2-C-methyl-D-erythritol 4-phosphate cytidylyltransferase [Bacteroides sp.]|nr:2-C-methyl-D-erythritol 4-phosphate cytidylyltransferase [Prevotella sp.]MCM1407873.1 2-C-methyl-D-erythritol 4-phosphate cytidylyltransferase [Treponema brennaborense]MCM1469615.1 2-C-methyl-D-erythritol 4-phosphate cytidylyltransferase [Bacteroides sp.]